MATTGICRAVYGTFQCRLSAELVRQSSRFLAIVVLSHTPFSVTGIYLRRPLKSRSDQNVLCD